MPFTAEAITLTPDEQVELEQMTQSRTLYHWARCSVQHDPLSKVHYARLRQVGHKHGRALRGVADRLLAVLIAMLKSGQPYEANRRQNGRAHDDTSPPKRNP